MSIDVRCPRCGEVVEGDDGCRHLRWVPRRGGPIDFAKRVVETSPYTAGRGFIASRLPEEWWESQHDWLLDRIVTRLDVVDGYCFGDPAELDRLCLDIWERFAPQPEPAGPPRMP